MWWLTVCYVEADSDRAGNVSVSESTVDGLIFF